MGSPFMRDPQATLGPAKSRMRPAVSSPMVYAVSLASVAPPTPKMIHVGKAYEGDTDDEEGDSNASDVDDTCAPLLTRLVKEK